MPLIREASGSYRFELSGTVVLQKTLDATAQRCRTIVERGGTRSSKTRSLIEIYVSRLFACKHRRMGIGRTTFPALRSSAYKELIEYLQTEPVLDEVTGSELCSLYDLVEHNKSDNVVRFGTNEIAFVSVDDPRKFRGPQWNDFWFNEANDFEYEHFQQINLRLTRPETDGLPNQNFLDFNPDDAEIWIKTKLEDAGRCFVIQSSYLDNPFLSDESIEEINYLRETDPNFWNVFGLGNYGERRKGIIYAGWLRAEQLPPGESIFGLDFGFNKPTALVECRMYERKLFWKERLFQTHLTNSDLIELLKTLDLPKLAPIYCDSAEPQRIQELYEAGFNVFPSDKSVKLGIDYCKRFPLYVLVDDSPNLVDEVKRYKWKEDKNGVLLDEPVKFKDHCLDAGRYACFTHGSQYWQETPYDTILPTAGSRKRRESLTERFN